MNKKNLSSTSFMDSLYRLTKPLAPLVATAFLGTVIGPRKATAFGNYGHVNGDTTGVYTDVEKGDTAWQLARYAGLADEREFPRFIQDVNLDCQTYLPGLADVLGFSEGKMRDILKRYIIDDMTSTGPGHDGIPMDQLRPGDPVYLSYETMDAHGIDRSKFGYFTAEPESLETKVRPDSTHVEKAPVMRTQGGVVLNYGQLIKIIGERFGPEAVAQMELYINRQVNTQIQDWLHEHHGEQGSWLCRHPVITGLGLVALATGTGLLGAKIYDKHHKNQHSGHYDEDHGGGNGVH